MGCGFDSHLGYHFNNQIKIKQMKKVFIFLITISLMFSLNSCEWFNKNKNNDKEEIVVENVVKADRDYMTANYGNTYVWYETQITLNDNLDEECDGSFSQIVDVFQVITTTDSVTFDTKVIKMYHLSDTSYIEEIEGFWVEDMNMNDEIISVTYKQAFQLINETNYPKPHSKNCVLRKEVGKIEANPQYIFGNFEAQLYVDALTGDVTDESPSFCNEEIVNDTIVEIANDTVGKPLGEWP